MLPNTPTPFERRAVLSAAVDIAPPEEILNYLVECADAHSGRSVVGISAPYAAAMKKDAALREAFLRADVLVADGKGFVWGARMLGVPCGERIAIPDLCERLLEAGDERGWKVFVYGATSDANTAAIANLKARFPGLAEVAGQHGYEQSEADENGVIARLREGKFNLLIVARPSPDKERFLARCCREAGVVGLAAGGYVDVLAGLKKRAPKFVQAIGMEWMYRLAQDPFNLWKRIGWANTKFAASALWNAALGVPRRPWFAQPALHVAALVAIVALAYTRSLDAPYHFDDPEYILRNTAIRSFGDVSKISITDHRPLWWYSNAICYKLSEKLGEQKRRLADAQEHWYEKLYYKVILENFGNHQPDRPDVRVFRAWNIACHLIAALALYGLLRRCLRARRCGEAWRLDNGGAIPAADLRPFAAAAIFAAHPLATEAVTYISGRDNGQGGMFYLLGLYFAAITFDRIGTAAAISGTDAGPRWPAWFWPSVATVVMGAFALITKESHILFPAAVALVYFVFFRKGKALSVSVGLLCGIVLAMGAVGWGIFGRRDGYLWAAVQAGIVALIAGALLGGTPKTAQPQVSKWAVLRAPFQKRVGAGWAFLFAFAGIAVAGLLAFPYAYGRIMDALTGYQGSSYERSLLTQANAVPKMLLRAVAPVSITVSPDFNISHSLNIDHQFPTISDLHDRRAWLGIGILSALTAVGIFGAIRGWLLSFGVLLALIVIAPTNSIFERGDIVSERNFYLAAAAGACVLAAVAGAVARWLVKKFEPANSRLTARELIFEAGLWTIIFAFCFAGPFTAFTIVRNHDWGDPYRLWKVAMEHSPEKIRVLYNFGVSAQQARRNDEAEAAFTRAIAVGEQLAGRGAFRPDEAVDVKCFHLAYARLADVYRLRQAFRKRSSPGFDAEDAKAIATIKKIYEDGLNRTAWDPDLAITYAEFLIHIGQAPEVVPMLQKSWSLHTYADQLYYPWGVGLLESGQYAAAAEKFEGALRLTDVHSLGYARPLDADYRGIVWALLGVARTHLKAEAQAREAFKTALRTYPEALALVMLSYNSARNLNLTAETTSDDFLNAISLVRRDVLRTMRDSVNELLADPPPEMPANLNEYKRVFDDELKRYEVWKRKRMEAGFKDDPEESEK